LNRYFNPEGVVVDFNMSNGLTNIISEQFASIKGERRHPSLYFVARSI
jgi:hypothetical protein